MISRVLALLAVSTMLSGCFSSTDELWPVKSGERVTLLPEGDYTCTSFSNGVPRSSEHTAISLNDGPNLYYHFDKDGSGEVYGSFHKILPDLYLFAVSNASEGDGIYTYVRMTERHAVFVTPTDAQKDEYAKKHGVDVGPFGELNGGESIQQRRNFVIDLGENLENSEMYQDCVPK